MYNMQQLAQMAMRLMESGMSFDHAIHVTAYAYAVQESVLKKILDKQLANEDK